MSFKSPHNPSHPNTLHRSVADVAAPQRRKSFSDRLPSQPSSLLPPRGGSPGNSSTRMVVSGPTTSIQKHRRTSSLSSEEDFLSFLPANIRKKVAQPVNALLVRRAAKLRYKHPKWMRNHSSISSTLHHSRSSSPILSHQSPKAPTKPVGATSSPQESAVKWIITYHNSWSRVCNSNFFSSIANGQVTPVQYSRWLRDRVSISMNLLEGATRASKLLNLKYPGKTLPILQIAKEDAGFLIEYATLIGYSIQADDCLSFDGGRFTEFIDTCTAPDAVPLIAITAVWSYMLVSWHFWELVKSKGVKLDRRFESIADHIQRSESLQALLQTRALIDLLLESSRMQEQVEKAGKTFQEVLDRYCAVLDYAHSLEDNSKVPVCRCGRKGHQPDQCTFKSHIRMP